MVMNNEQKGGITPCAHGVNFDLLMGQSNPYYAKNFKQCLASQKKFAFAAQPLSADELYRFFKQLYEKNLSHEVALCPEPKIQHIVHMIWLGGALPAEYEAYRLSWLQFHRAWTHILWVDNPLNYAEGEVIKDIGQLREGVLSGKLLVADVNILKLRNQHAFQQAPNYAEKADILRYELLYQFGGLYVDTDFECYKSFDLLHARYDFYTGIQPLDVGVLCLANGLMAGASGHIIFDQCITLLNTRREAHSSQAWIPISTGTGPIHFTRVFWQAAKAEGAGKVIAMPASYFYPVGMNQGHLSRSAKQTLLQSESYAIHHWAASWHAKSILGRIKRVFQGLRNC